MPPPPYRPIKVEARSFGRGQPPDLESWRMASLSRHVPQEDDPGPVQPRALHRADGLAIGIAGTGSPRPPNWSLRRRPPSDPGSPEFTLPPPRTQPPSGLTETDQTPDDARADPVRLGVHPYRDQHAGESLVDRMRRIALGGPAAWAAVPLAAGILGGALYVLRYDVMWAFPGTIPVYATLGLAGDPDRKCEDAWISREVFPRAGQTDPCPEDRSPTHRPSQ
jgi:hypothetical protein